MELSTTSIKNAENFFAFKQIMKTWDNVYCKCNLYENFSLNANTKQIPTRKFLDNDLYLIKILFLEVS